MVIPINGKWSSIDLKLPMWHKINVLINVSTINAPPLQIRTKSVANPIYCPLHETDLERICSELEAKEKLCIRVLSERILAASLRERCHVYRMFFMSY